MARAHGAEPIYAMADAFRARCLIEQRSLLWPNEAAWTPANLDALWDAFIGNPIEGKQSFMEKWKEQLREQPRDVHRIAADVTALYYLFPGNITSGTKRSGVREVLGWRLHDEGDPPEMPALDNAFERSIGHAGTYYSTQRPWQVAFYLLFARRILARDAVPFEVESSRHLADQVLAEVKGSTPARNILLHLLFPNDFERISSAAHKNKIVKTFSDLAGTSPDVDIRLLSVRNALSDGSDPADFDFYQPEIKAKWDPATDPVTPNPPVDNVEISPPPAGSPPPDSKVNDLASVSHQDLADIAEIASLLLEKKQIIFEGPPGSGKTFLADLFARYFTGNPLDGEHNEQIEVVQFHQSYGYEDFVQGIRPVTDENGNLQYRVVPGIFLRQCELAAKNPDQRFVLIIDEINRGNLSRIFGELLMLLEYREKRVRLPYAAGEGNATAGPTHLAIPPNLYLIGTMNSTDRSLSMIDYALRRRFFFYRLLPVFDGKATTLDRWMVAKGFAVADRQRVLAYFVHINTEIGTRLSADFQVGHSYFMVADIATPDGLSRVWRRALKPLLEEYFHSARGLDEVIAALAPDTKQSGVVVPNEVDPLDDPDEIDGLSAQEE